MLVSSDGMYGRVKKALQIESRRVGGKHGHFEWRLPTARS
jgi:hypothetical protein